MRGVQALVRIRGHADIEKETQDLSVRGAPELAMRDSRLSPTVRCVNPVIGIGTFIAQLALRGQIQEFFSYEYDVSGPWVDPKVVEKRRPVAPTQPSVTP